MLNVFERLVLPNNSCRVRGIITCVCCWIRAGVGGACLAISLNLEKRIVVLFLNENDEICLFTVDRARVWLPILK